MHKEIKSDFEELDEALLILGRELIRVFKLKEVCEWLTKLLGGGK